MPECVESGATMDGPHLPPPPRWNDLRPGTLHQFSLVPDVDRLATPRSKEPLCSSTLFHEAVLVVPLKCGCHRLKPAAWSVRSRRVLSSTLDCCSDLLDGGSCLTDIGSGWRFGGGGQVCTSTQKEWKLKDGWDKNKLQGGARVYHWWQEPFHVPWLFVSADRSGPLLVQWLSWRSGAALWLVFFFFGSNGDRQWVCCPADLQDGGGEGMHVRFLEVLIFIFCFCFFSSNFSNLGGEDFRLRKNPHFGADFSLRSAFLSTFFHFYLHKNFNFFCTKRIECPNIPKIMFFFGISGNMQTAQNAQNWNLGGISLVSD